MLVGAQGIGCGKVIEVRPRLVLRSFMSSWVSSRGAQRSAGQALARPRATTRNSFGHNALTCRCAVGYTRVEGRMTTRYTLTPTLPPRALWESLWMSLGQVIRRGNASGPATVRSGRRGLEARGWRRCESAEGLRLPQGSVSTERADRDPERPVALPGNRGSCEACEGSVLRDATRARNALERGTSRGHRAIAAAKPRPSATDFRGEQSLGVGSATSQVLAFGLSWDLRITAGRQRTPRGVTAPSEGKSLEEETPRALPVLTDRKVAGDGKRQEGEKP